MRRVVCSRLSRPVVGHRRPASNPGERRAMIVVEDAGDDAVAGQPDELPSAGAVPAGTGQAVDDTGQPGLLNPGAVRHGSVSPSVGVGAGRGSS